MVLGLIEGDLDLEMTMKRSVTETGGAAPKNAAACAFSHIAPS